MGVHFSSRHLDLSLSLTADIWAEEVMGWAQLAANMSQTRQHRHHKHRNWDDFRSNFSPFAFPSLSVQISHRLPLLLLIVFNCLLGDFTALIRTLISWAQHFGIFICIKISAILRFHLSQLVSYGEKSWLRSAPEFCRQFVSLIREFSE